MDLHVAGRVKQDTVITPVASALAAPHDVVTMPPCKLCNPVAAVRTDATLVHPESQQLPFPPEVALHRHVETRFKVRFPGGVKRVSLLADGHVPFDRHVRCSVEIDAEWHAIPALDISGEAPVIGSTWREVLGLPPRRTFPRVSPFDPPPQLLTDRMVHGVWESETFAYAESKDDGTDRYRGLAGGRHVTPTLEGGSVLVKPEVARRQLDEDEAERRRREAEHRLRDGDIVSDPEDDTPSRPEWDKKVPEPSKQKALRRFHGSVRLSALRLGRDASVVADEIVAQLAALPGAEVEVTLEIRALLADGVPDDVVRTVTENAATLKFSSQGFEED
jgi:hypothetical protein